MSEEEKKKGRRPETRVWLYAERWLWGSTRSELENEERAVWIDFIALASFHRGEIEVFSRDQLAAQLCVSRELLERCIEKFLFYKKIKIKQKKSEKKEVFLLTKFEKLQPGYLTEKPYKSTRRSKKKKTQKSDAHVDPLGEERRGEKKRGEENGGDKDKKAENPPQESSPNSPLPSTPSKKEEFLRTLNECRGYPYDEFKDTVLFDVTVSAYPKINILKQLRRKIEWWGLHQDALKNNPRKQLEGWFKGEDKFQKQGGPQRLGSIMKEVQDPDHRNYLSQILEDKKTGGE